MVRQPLLASQPARGPKVAADFVDASSEVGCLLLLLEGGRGGWLPRRHRFVGLLLLLLRLGLIAASRGHRRGTLLARAVGGVAQSAVSDLPTVVRVLFAEVVSRVGDQTKGGGRVGGRSLRADY